MPWGDGTGPMGLGPMTGRGAGYCAGYPVPGYLNPWAPGWGWRGRGRGWRWRFWATGVPGWAWGPAPWAGPWGFGPPWAEPLSREQEAELLRDEAEFLKEQQELLQQQIDEINRRLQELEQGEKE